MWRKPPCQTLPEVSDISNAVPRVALDLLKTLAILSDATARRSTVDQEDWNSEDNHTGNQQKDNISLGD